MASDLEVPIPITRLQTSQQQNTAWVQTRGSILYKHAPLGLTVKEDKEIPRRGNL